MSTTSEKWMVRAGWTITGLVTLLMLWSASMKFMGGPQIDEVFVGKLGFTQAKVLPIGVLELCCTLLYVVPRTTVLGVVLLTGYLGGAIVAHMRVDDAFGLVIVIGALAWAGVFLRDARVRALLPIRQSA